MDAIVKLFLSHKTSYLYMLLSVTALIYSKKRKVVAVKTESDTHIAKMLEI